MSLERSRRLHCPAYRMPARTLRPNLLTLCAAVAALIAALLAGGAAVVYGGLYDVSAERPHTQLVYSLLELTMRQSVRRQARHIEERPSPSAHDIQRGAACFRSHCQACHGAPGVAPAAAALAMQPLPGPLQQAAKAWRQRELVWITRHGIRMSAMPAWAGRLSDDNIWAVAAFIQQLPLVSPADWRDIDQQTQGLDCPVTAPETSDHAQWAHPATELDNAAGRGRAALQRHGCHGCHLIPGVVGSQQLMGPPLAGYAHRTSIKGRLPHTQANLVRWIRNPQAVDPGTAMPSYGVGEADARAMAAYLGTLR